MKKKNFILSVFMCLVFLGTTMMNSSCDDPVAEKVKGCTDSEAENYDSLADSDDGTCVYARDKFLGEFMGTLLCGAPLPPSSAFTMVITEGLSGNNEVQIEFKGTTNPLPILNGTASGKVITVPESTYQVAINPDTPDVLTEVLMSASATISDDEKSISGNINASVFSFPVPCTFTASR